MNKHILILTAFLIPAGLAAPALLAQQEQPWQPPLADQQTPLGDDGGVTPESGTTEGTDEGADLIGRGVGILMENLLRDLGPGLDQLGQDMTGTLNRMAPVFDDLATLVDDLGNYQAPERLENGDIIIRRKPGAPPPPPLGQNLRDLARPDQDGQPQPSTPRDPYAPEIEL